MSSHHRDESDFRDRATSRNSRPRTKQRPEHADAESGFVTGVDRGRYTLLLDESLPTERAVIAMKARELTRQRVVCGDRVEVVGDTSGLDGSLSRIVRITERVSVLRRTADDTDPYERIIVANADQLVVVTALAEPEPRTRMIDRCVVAAYEAGMQVLLCLTKADLASPDDLIALYEPLGVDIVVTSQGPDGAISNLPDVRAALAGKLSVLVGHSGVGKSTLVNSLVPDALRSTGVVNVVTGRGRHTSTSAVALRLPEAAGWVIDTPGVRSFGLAHVDLAGILAAFEDLARVAESCPRGCTHADDAPDCALDTWALATPAEIAARPEPVRAADAAARPLEPGAPSAGLVTDPVRAARLNSFRRLLTSRS